MQDELRVTPDVGSAHVRGQRPAAEVIPGHAELMPRLGQPVLDLGDLRLLRVEALLRGVEVGLDRRDLPVDRGHPTVERSAPGRGRIDAAQERRLLGGRLRHLRAQRVELRVVPRGGGRSPDRRRPQTQDEHAHEHCHTEFDLYHDLYQDA